MSTDKQGVEILGESFEWCKQDGLVTITHPKWSCYGFGKDLQGAIIKLIDDMLILKPIYASIDDSELTTDALDLKIWLMAINKSQPPQPERVSVDDFQIWLRTVCFQKPTPEAESLALRAWKEVVNRYAPETDRLRDLEKCDDT